MLLLFLVILFFFANKDRQIITLTIITELICSYSNFEFYIKAIAILTIFVIYISTKLINFKQIKNYKELLTLIMTHEILGQIAIDPENHILLFIIRGASTFVLILILHFSYKLIIRYQ